MDNGKGIRTLVEDYILEQASKFRVSQSFHYSDSGKCHRMRILKRLGFEQRDKTKSDILSLGKFLVGNLFHEFVQKALHYNIIKEEFRVESEDKMFSGRIDMLVEAEAAKSILVDIKTVHSRKFDYLEKGDKTYEMQLCNYYICLKDKYDIKDCRLLYISKDDFRMAEIGVPMTDELIKKTTEDNIILLELWKLCKKNVLELPTLLSPDCPEIWQCGYCGFSDHCEG